MARLSVGGLRALMVALSRSEPDPLTVRQVAALLAISEAGNEVKFGDLADILGATPASTSRSIDALEARGLVDRVQIGRGGRITIVMISDKGVEYVDGLLGRTELAA